MKARRTRILLSSALILLPVLAGLLLWNRLPDRMPTHFDFSGTPNGWSGKPFAVFGLPLFLLFIHLLCLYGTSRDPRRGNAGAVMNGLVFWIVPAVSLFVAGIMYPAAMGPGYEINITFFSLVFTGVLFLIVGNYLPKCRQNHVIGIRVPWTLKSEAVWNRTHRMAGPLWMLAGLLLLTDAFLRAAVPAVVIAALITAGVVPIVYAAYLYYGKGYGRREDC